MVTRILQYAISFGMFGSAIVVAFILARDEITYRRTRREAEKIFKRNKRD